MASLYEINERIRAWQTKVIEQEGELSDVDIKELESLEVEKRDKIEAYAVIIKETIAERVMFENEIKRLEKARDQRKNMAKRMTLALDNFMQTQGIGNFYSPKAQITYSKSVAVDIEENAKIPEEYMRVKTEADKTAIKQFLQNGGTIDGCQIVEKKNIQIK